MEKLKSNMKRLAALISTSLATDWSHATVEVDDRISDSNDQPIQANVLNPSVPVQLAGHRSHSSHSSHSSHRSSSGGYGTYDYPSASEKRTTTSQSTPSTTASPTPDIKTYNTNALSKDALQNTIQRVQLALTYAGYYKGSIDGVMGPETRASITAYRKVKLLKSSAYIDAELLNSLGIMLSQ